MVMLTRGWQRFVALLTVFTALGRSMTGVFAAHAPHDDETAESELAAHVHAQSLAQAPAPAPSMPVGNRWVQAAPQDFPRSANPVDEWMRGSPRVLLESTN
jgi:hypothetical protein